VGIAAVVFVSLFLFGSSLSSPVVAIEAASQTVIEDGAEGMTRGVNRMLGGIISYARWPGEAPGTPRTMCLVGEPHLSHRIAPTIAGGPVISVRRTTSGGAAGGNDCDIIFIGRMPVADRQRIIAWVRGKPVLTVTDDDATCSYGAMFCLTGRVASISFSVNLDAIGRGSLRIDPRVLKIGSGGDQR
jgi:hypothetical protein